MTPRPYLYRAERIGLDEAITKPRPRLELVTEETARLWRYRRSVRRWLWVMLAALMGAMTAFVWSL